MRDRVAFPITHRKTQPSAINKNSYQYWSRRCAVVGGSEWGAVKAKLCQNERFLDRPSKDKGSKLSDAVETPSNVVPQRYWGS